jgi:hypothetical protein
MGVPSHLSSAANLEAIATFCSDNRIPRAFSAQVEIQRQVVRYTTALEDVVDTRTCYCLVQLFDRELENIRTRFHDSWSPLVEISLLTAKLFLYSLCFIYDKNVTLPSALVSTDAMIPFRVILYSGHATAVRLIHLYAQAKTEIPTAASDHIRYRHVAYYPKHYPKSVVFAAIFLLKFIAIEPHAPESDLDLARNHVNIVYRIFNSFRGWGEYHRGAKMIEVLTRMTSPGSGQVKPHVNYRLGASIHYDAIRTAITLRDRSAEAANVTATDPRINERSTGEPIMVEQMVPQTPAHEKAPASTASQQMDNESAFPWGLWDESIFDWLGLDDSMAAHLDGFRGFTP